MPGGSGTGIAQDATLRQLLVALGGGGGGFGGSGTGIAQDATLKKILAAIVAPASVVVRVVNGVNSPYNANPGELVIPDTSAGSVVVNLPVLALGQRVVVVHDSNTSLAAATVTINGPMGVALAQPPPNNAAGFISPFVYGGATPVFGGEAARGMSLTYFNGGSGGGYLLD